MKIFNQKCWKVYRAELLWLVFRPFKCLMLIYLLSLCQVSFHSYEFLSVYFSYFRPSDLWLRIDIRKCRYFVSWQKILWFFIHYGRINLILLQFFIPPFELLFRNNHGNFWFTQFFTMRETGIRKRAKLWQMWFCL